MDPTFFTIICGAAIVLAVAAERARQLTACRPEPNPSLDDGVASDAQWRELAQRYGLTLITGAEFSNRHPDDRKLIGQLHGFPMELAVEQDTNRALRCWGRIRFRPALGLALDIDQVRRFFEDAAVRVGDARFDRTFVVRARVTAVCFLTSAVRVGLLRVSDSAHRVALTDDGLWWSRRRADPWGDGIRLVQVESDLKQMDELARAFRDAVQRVEHQVAADADDPLRCLP
ncbi:MAG: hypothetical protein CMH57_12910 [Myxococcales bacterium]|nr:hypothetical protein [Myxococcales bacterium]